MEKIEVLLVDDQDLFIESLKTVLQLKDNNFLIYEIKKNGKEAVESVRKKQPDIILMDVRMPVMDGVEATKRILEEYPQIKIIMLTTFDDDEYVKKALQYGAMGYLLKNIKAEELILTMHSIMSGNVFVAPSIARKLVTKDSSDTKDYENNLEKSTEWIDCLSQREKEILWYIINGYDNKYIADKLLLGDQTIKNYISNIYSKSGIHSRLSLIQNLQNLYSKKEDI